MSSFKNLKEQVESEKKIKFSLCLPWLLRTSIKSWSITLEYDLDTCFITETEQLSDLEPALAIAILFLPLFPIPRYIETQGVRMETS